MTLTELLDEGRRAWPTLGANPPIAALVERKASGAPLDEVLGSLDATEVFLAAALLACDSAAPAAFEQRYFNLIDPPLRRAGATSDERDEVRQLLRVRLFTRDDDGVPRLVDYCGYGRLAGLLRVSALRAFVNLRAKRKPEEDLDEALATRVAAELDPRSAHVNEEERAAVTEAIRATARALRGRSRTLLRLSLVDGLSIDELGRVFAIHRATAARQLARARDELVAGVRARLAELWGTDALSLSLIASQLEISLGRALATPSP